MSDKKLSKIGAHVNANGRDNFGDLAPHLNNVVTFDVSVARELRDDAIIVGRTQEVHNHKDAPGDFDRLDFEDLHEVGRWWLDKMVVKWREMCAGDEELFKRIYWQQTNEINSPAPDASKGETQPRILEYTQGAIDRANELGIKIALLGDAGGSPDHDLWMKYWLPFLKRNSGNKSLIYNVHTYTWITEGQSEYFTKNTTPIQTTHDIAERPLKWARIMRENGVDIPMLISEFGWKGGHTAYPRNWKADLLRYNKLVMEHDNIIGLSIWTFGAWKEGVALINGAHAKSLAKTLDKVYEPVFFNGYSNEQADEPTVEPIAPVVEPEIPEVDEEEAVQPKSFKEWLQQKVEDQRTLSLNSDAGIEKAIKADGFIPSGNEEWSFYDENNHLAVQGAVNFDNKEERAYYVTVGDWSNIKYEVIADGERDAVQEIQEKQGGKTEPEDNAPVEQEEQENGILYGIDVTAPNPVSASGHYELIDVARYQGEFDYSRLPDHVMGVIAKFTEGRTWKDPLRLRNHDQAKAHNKIFGAYHYFHATVNPELQAEHFWNETRNLEQIHFWVVDVEHRLPTDNDPFYDQMLLRFLRKFESLSQRRPFIYSALWAINELTTNPKWLAPYPAWMAHYQPGRSGPMMPLPWFQDDWKLWQYTSTNRSYIGSNLDVNRTRMNRVQFLEFTNSLRLPPNSTVTVIDDSTEPDPAPTPTKIDLRPYVLPPAVGTGNYVMQTVDGPHEGKSEVFNIWSENNVLWILKNHLYERYFIGSRYWFSDMDISPANDSQGNPRYYQVRALSTGLAPRFPLSMHIGEVWTGSDHWVQFYHKDTGKNLSENSGLDKNRAELIAVGTWKSQYTNREFANCAVMRLGTELQVFQGGKLIAWQSKWGASEYASDQGNIKDQPRKDFDQVHPPQV